MKLILTLLSATVLFAPTASVAQTAAPAKPHTAAAAHTAAATAAHCVKLPPLSPKIPALPAGAPCAKPLYTIVTTPGVKLIDVSPLENPGLADALGIPAPASITLAYVDIKAGTGELAAPHKFYSMKYRGYLVDGTEFDSSEKHPESGSTFSFQQGPQGPQGQRQVIVGWDTGLDGMRIGGKRRLFIPFQLAYGPAGRPPSIPAKAMLIFDVEFVGQSDKDPNPPKTPPAPPAAAAPAKPATAPTPPAAQTAPAAAPPATPPAATAPASTPPATPAAATPPKPQ